MARDVETSSDPVYRSSLRELRWILFIWFIFLLWVVGYCGLFGYQTEEAALTTILGMPSWVFGGVFLPWIAATIVTCWFALTQIEDHPLQDPTADDETSGEPADG
jgi:hypothetical protein